MKSILIYLIARLSRGVKRAGAGALGILLASVLVGCGGSDGNQSGVVVDRDAGFYSQWSWFKGTYWIAPPDGIYSVNQVASENSFFTIRGQTVFSITDYYNGYFTGSVVVKITEKAVTSCQFVLGQVTPEGQVFMTMYKADTGAVVNYPLGTMVLKDDQWTMVNQMTSLTEPGTLSHWAYMIQSRPGDGFYESLPFVNQPIPEFLASCPPGPIMKRQP